MTQSAIKIREDSRIALNQKLQFKASSLMLDCINFEELQMASNPQNLFNTMWDNFEQELQAHKHFQDYYIYVDAFNHTIKECQRKIEHHQIDIGFPKLIVTSERPQTFRTYQWFSDGKQVLAYYQFWLNELADRPDGLTVFDVMLSLIFHSAVLKPVLIEAVILSVINQNIELLTFFGLPAVTVHIDNPEWHTNAYVDTQPTHESHVFLSMATVIIIQKFLQQRKAKSKSLSDKPQNISSLYKALLNKSIKPNTGIVFGIQRFLKASIYVMENYLGYDLDEWSWYLLLEKGLTYALPIENWQSMIYDIRHDTQSNLVLDGTKQPKHSTSHRPRTLLASEISALFKTDNNLKRSETKFKQSLEQLFVDLQSLPDIPLSELVIVGWMMMKSETCKSSSLDTYRSEIVNRWLAMTDDMDLVEFEADDFTTLYQDIIALGKTDKVRNTIASHLDNIHGFMVENYDNEPIAPLAQTADGVRPHHKTGYLSEAMFQAVIANVANLNITQAEQQAIRLALLLGQRCGLRIGEMVKIRMRDVAESDDYLEIRENRHGNNKTSSALRRVLLRELLTREDMIFFARVAHARRVAKGDTLIATSAGSAFTATVLSKTLSQLIKQTTGLKYLSTHHLRHSCLTNFQLMSFLYDEDHAFTSDNNEAVQGLKKLLPYDDDKAISILKAIQPPMGYKKYYALAGVAGHSSPSTTFASYVHLTDIQFGLKLWYQDFKFNKHHARIFDVPRRKIDDFLHFPNVINNYWLKKAKLKPIVQPIINKKLNSQSSTQPKIRRYDFNEVKQVLDAYTNHDKDAFDHLMHIFEINDETFQKWLSNAKLLQADIRLITKQGNSRLFDSDDKSSLLPNFDRLSDDRTVMIEMTNAYRTLYQKKSQRIKLYKWVWHTLTHCQIYKNHIDFYSAKALFDYLKILTELVDRNDIRLRVLNADYLSTLPKRQLNAWQKSFKVLPKSQITYQDSKTFGDDTYAKSLKVELSLASQNESMRIANQEASSRPISKWTVRTLQIFCHYVFVMIGERISENVEATMAETKLDTEE